MTMAKRPYKERAVYRRVQRFLRALDAPQPQLEGPVKIDELYVKVGFKGR